MMLYFSFFFSFYSTCPLNFVLVSRKQIRSNWRFNTVCRILSIIGDYFSR